MSTPPIEYDVFISHASEDKASFVRDLASLLVRLGLRVWYDEDRLQIGDSLSRTIDNGLAHSRFGVLVMSEHFLKKPWPEYELRGLLAREIGGQKVILPIWLDVSREQVLAYSPSLADKYALSFPGNLFWLPSSSSHSSHPLVVVMESI